MDVSVPLLISSVAAVAAVLSWRSAEITTLEEKEQILHQRYIDTHSVSNGDYSLVNPIRLRTWPDDNFTAKLSKYVTGTESGSVEITMVGKSSSVPTEDGIRNHPWYDAINADVASVGPHEGDFDFVLSVLFYTSEPNELQDEILWMEMIIDSICGGVDADDIPDSPSKNYFSSGEPSSLASRS